MSTHVTDRLSGYVDGALPVRELEEVRAHVAACGTCWRAYEELRVLKDLLRGLPDPVPPAGLVERVRWRLLRASGRRAGEGKGVLLGWGLRAVLACTAVVLVLGLPLGWFAGTLGPREAPLDTDTYLRDYLVLAADHRWGDEVTPTLLAGDGPVQEPASR